MLIGAHLQKLFQVGDSLLLFAKTFVSEPTLAVTIGIIGAKLDGPGIVGDGPWVMALSKSARACWYSPLSW